MPLVLSFAGDALWILAMAIIAATSRGALKVIPRGVKVPVVGRKLRAPRGPAFTLAVGAPLIVGLGLLAVGRLYPQSVEAAIIVFGVRATIAALWALAHVVWVRVAVEILADEGQLNA